MNDHARAGPRASPAAAAAARPPERRSEVSLVAWSAGGALVAVCVVLSLLVAMALTGAGPDDFA